MRYTLTLLTLLLFIGITNNALACDCPVNKDTAVDAWQKSDVVFLGTVAIIDNTTTEEIITLQAKKFWKGLRTSKVMVYSSLSDWSCDFEFSPQTTYVVFANYDDKQKLRANVCGFTALEEKAANTIGLLGTPLDAPQDTPRQWR